MVTASQSTNASSASRHITTTINAIDPLETARRNAAKGRDLPASDTTRSTNAAKTNDGPKMPSVATNAPPNPARCQPMNVAVVNTGPGVNCPTEMASSNTSGEIQPRSTTSLSRNTSNTYPLP